MRLTFITLMAGIVAMCTSCSLAETLGEFKPSNFEVGGGVTLVPPGINVYVRPVNTDNEED